MADSEVLKKWLSEGKQVGKVNSYELTGERYWTSVGIQKWGDVVKVYVDEILESEMDAENYLREEILEFTDVNSALAYIDKNTRVTLDEIAPCKGQKIFNPRFNHP